MTILMDIIKNKDLPKIHLHLIKKTTSKYQHQVIKFTATGILNLILEKKKSEKADKACCINLGLVLIKAHGFVLSYACPK